MQQSVSMKMENRLRIGILGAGSFAHPFIKLFQAHPGVESVSVAELLPQRRQQAVETFGLAESFSTYEDLLESDIDAVAIFTQRWKHAEQAIRALRAGKHVYSAVPAGITVEELEALEQTVRETGLNYMMGETSYYKPSTIFCRDRFQKGLFGQIVYADAEYCHDMEHGFYPPYQGSNGAEWKRYASFPPMLYPSHSVGTILAITGSHMTSVSCLGMEIEHPDGIFDKNLSQWQNSFCNQTALFSVSDGSMCRINEHRRVASRGEKVCVYGTKGGFEEQTGAIAWIEHGTVGVAQDLTEDLSCQNSPIARGDLQKEVIGTQEDFFSGVSRAHDVSRLPATYRGIPNGHRGSHHFLADDFVQSTLQGKLAPTHVWNATRYCLPGIIAHESSLRSGERLTIPDLGDAPAERSVLGPSPKLDW